MKVAPDQYESPSTATMESRKWILFLNVIIFMAQLLSCEDQAATSTPFQTDKQAIDSLVQQASDARNAAPGTIDELADSTIKLSKAINYLEGEIGGLYQKSIGYFLQSQYSKSEEYSQLVLEKLDQSPSLDSSKQYLFRGSVYTLLGILKEKTGNYNEAVSLQLKALSNYEKLDDWNNIAVVYTNLSLDFKFIKNFEKALYYNKKAEEYFIKAGKPEKNVSVLQNRGTIISDQGDYETALEIFKTTLEKAKAIDDMENVANAHNNIGVAYEELGHNEIAFQNYLAALQIHQNRNNYWGEANTLGNISLIHYKNDELDKAKQYSDLSLLISQENQFLELEKFNVEILAKIYEKQGNFEESVAMLKQVQSLQDSLYNQQKFETINRLEQQYNEERSNRIIAQQDKAIIESELRSQQLQWFISVLGLVFLLLISVAGLLYRQAKFRKEKNQELLLKNTTIQNQNEDLESLVDAYKAQKEKFIQIGNHEILLDDIIYIRYQDRISTIFLKDLSTVEHRIQLSQLMSELSYKSHFLFSQINQNYIVHFKMVTIDHYKGEEEEYYFTHYLPHDLMEGRNEDYIKTRKRSGLNKTFEREYKRYRRLENLIK